jgi:hypothetical protein
MAPVAVPAAVHLSRNAISLIPVKDVAVVQPEIDISQGGVYFLLTIR